MVSPESYRIVVGIDKKRRWVLIIFECWMSWCGLHKPNCQQKTNYWRVHEVQETVCDGGGMETDDDIDPEVAAVFPAWRFRDVKIRFNRGPWVDDSNSNFPSAVYSKLTTTSWSSHLILNCVMGFPVTRLHGNVFPKFSKGFLYSPPRHPPIQPSRNIEWGPASTQVIDTSRWISQIGFMLWNLNLCWWACHFA